MGFISEMDNKEYYRDKERQKIKKGRDLSSQIKAILKGREIVDWKAEELYQLIWIITPVDERPYLLCPMMIGKRLSKGYLKGLVVRWRVKTGHRLYTVRIGDQCLTGPSMGSEAPIKAVSTENADSGQTT